MSKENIFYVERKMRSEPLCPATILLLFLNLYSYFIHLYPSFSRWLLQERLKVRVFLFRYKQRSQSLPFVL